MYLPEKPKAPVTAIRTPAFRQTGKITYSARYRNAPNGWLFPTNRLRLRAGLDSVAFVASARGVYLVVRDPADEERRLFLPVKNNIGKIRTGLSFRIVEKPAPAPVLDEQPAIEWDNGAVNMTADEAMAWKEDGRKSEAAERAKVLLQETLANGPAKMTDVRARAAELGIRAKSLRTAKDAIGVVSTKIGTAWWWSLAGQPAPM